MYTACKQMRLGDIIAPGRETGRGSVKAFNTICGNKSRSLVTKQRHKHMVAEESRVLVIQSSHFSFGDEELLLFI